MSINDNLKNLLLYSKLQKIISAKIPSEIIEHLQSLFDNPTNPILAKIEKESNEEWASIEKYITSPNNSQDTFELSLWKQLSDALSPVMPFNKTPKIEPIRIYIDGCFDLMHSGHYNAIRQARKLGDRLVVGVVSDQEITKNKGIPIMSLEERIDLLRACKWVDEVVPNVPYDCTVEMLDKLKCHYNAHGDDIAKNSEGVDSNILLKIAGRFKMFKRTEGISTTEIIGRLLLMSKNNDLKQLSLDKPIKSSELDAMTTNKAKGVQFLATAKRIMQFSNKQEQKPTDKVVYIDGSFDLFHTGHVQTLKKAKELGDYLIVGLHDDDTVNKHRGKNYPIMGLFERALCVLSCRYVNEVVLAAPWHITKELITSLNISIVCEGTLKKVDDDVMIQDLSEEDTYKIPKELGIYKKIQSTSTLTTDKLILRVIANREEMLKKHVKGEMKEKKYEDSKVFVAEK